MDLQQHEPPYVHRSGVCHFTVFHCALHRLSRLQSASSAAVFRVVVNKHVVRHGQDMAIYAHGAGQDHLKDSRGFSVEAGHLAVGQMPGYSSIVNQFHTQGE